MYDVDFCLDHAASSSSWALCSRTAEDTASALLPGRLLDVNARRTLEM